MAASSTRQAKKSSRGNITKDLAPASGGNHDSDSNLNNLLLSSTLNAEDSSKLSGLSEESQTLFALLNKVFAHQMVTVLQSHDKKIEELNSKIDGLNVDIRSLEKRVQQQEDTINDLTQQGHKNVYIMSGNGVPPTSTEENCKQLLIDTIRSKVNINLRPNDILDVHRLGRFDINRAQLDKRPIRFRISDSRIMRDLIGSLSQKRPDVFINESLCPQRKALMDKVRIIKKRHPALIAQCYSRDGTINIKKTRTGERVQIKTDLDLENYFLSIEAPNTNSLLSIIDC